MKISRRAFLMSTATTMALVTAIPAFAAEPPVFTGSDFAIRGYDTVAYFDENGPVAGLQAHQTEWNGATWLFASDENLQKFVANPEKFAPQYGGYCAYAVSRNYTAKTEPEAWNIVDGKLYLNFSLSIRNLWQRNIPKNIADADLNWPSVLG